MAWMVTNTGKHMNNSSKVCQFVVDATSGRTCGRRVEWEVRHYDGQDRRFYKMFCGEHEDEEDDEYEEGSLGIGE